MNAKCVILVRMAPLVSTLLVDIAVSVLRTTKGSIVMKVRKRFLEIKEGVVRENGKCYDSKSMEKQRPHFFYFLN